MLELEDGSRPSTPKEINWMKKIMSLMLGLSLIMGAASFAFGQEPTKKEEKKKKKKAKKGTEDKK
jgi:hypothetical protein